MKTLIVYFSLEGNTCYVAERIAAKSGADTLRLIPKKAYRDKGFAKFLWGGKSAIMAEKPELMPYRFNAEEYESIVFGFPIWASNFTPPIRTFIFENANALKGKKISAFACQSGTGGEKVFPKLQKCIGCQSFQATEVFTDPKSKQSDSTDARIDDFIKRLSEI